MTRQIILDTETTGLSPEKGHRIIEIGCLEMVNRRITDNHFHCYINPRRRVEKAAEQVHGITDEFLKDKPFFEDILEDLVAFIRGAELIIHNAPFDVGFLNHEFKLARFSEDVTNFCQVTDTLSMARKKHPGQPNSLDALCRRYSVDNSNRDLHGALLDSELLAQVYLTMTGGQEHLFQTTNTHSGIVDETVSALPVSKNRKPLPVIQASADELSAHEDYLNMLRDNGHCVWSD